MDTNENLPVVQSTSVAAVTPMQLLKIAMDKGADLDRLERLMALQERYEKNEAEKAFNLALSKFKALGIVIGKDGNVNYSTDRGLTSYRHATLGNVCSMIGPALAEFDLSVRWNTQQVDGGKIRVTCILSHAMGHKESVSLEYGSDTSGGKNGIQGIGSTVSYLERYTVLAVTGTATADQGLDDGQGVGEETEAEAMARIAAAEAEKAELAKKLQEEREKLPLLEKDKFDELCKDKLRADDPGIIQKMGLKSLVTSGKKTSDHIIGNLEMKYRIPDTLKAVINGWATPKNQGE